MSMIFLGPRILRAASINMMFFNGFLRFTISATVILQFLNDFSAVLLRSCTIYLLCNVGGGADHYTKVEEAGSMTCANITAKTLPFRVDFFDGDNPAKDLWDNITYDAYQYTQRAVDIVHAHNVSTPFFLYWVLWNFLYTLSWVRPEGQIWASSNVIMLGKNNTRPHQFEFGVSNYMV